MAVGIVGGIGRLGLKAAGAILKGVKATPAVIAAAPGKIGSAAMKGTASAGGAVLRASVNIPTNIAKAYWNGHMDDLGVSMLKVKTGNVLNKRDPSIDPVTGRKREPERRPRVYNTRPESSGLGMRAASAIIKALEPLNDINKTLDGIDGSLEGMRSDGITTRGDIQRGFSNLLVALKANGGSASPGGGDSSNILQGIRQDGVAMRGEVQRGFGSVLVALKLLQPNAFNQLRDKRGHHNDINKHLNGKDGKTGSGGGVLGGILGGLASMLANLFGPRSAVMSGLGVITTLAKGAGRALLSVANGIGRAATAIARTGGRMVGRGIRSLAVAGRNASTGIGRRAAMSLNRITAPVAAVEAVAPHTPPVEPHGRPTGSPPHPGATPETEPHGRPRTPVEIEAEKARINRPLNDAPRIGEPGYDPKRVAPTVEADGTVKSKFEPNKVAVKPTPPASPNTVAKALAATETPAPVATEAGKPTAVTEPSAPVEPAKPTTKVEPEVKAEPKAEPKTKIPKADRSLTKQLSKVLGKSMIVLGVALEAWDAYDQWADAYDKYQAGEISPKDYRKETVRIVGGAAGSVGGGAFLGLLGGAVAGAAAGPAAPITSTILGIGGGLVGGVIGSMAGKELGNKVGNKAADLLIGQTDDEDKKLQPGMAEYKARDLQPQSQAIPPSNYGIPTPTPETSTPTTSPVQSVEVQTPQANQAQQMVAQSQAAATRNAQQQRAPVIIAPQTTNNNTTNNGGGGGSPRPAVGSPRPDMNPMDSDLMGKGIGSSPGSFGIPF